MVKEITEHLFPRHLMDAFREQALGVVKEEERREFEKGMEFEGAGE